MDSKQAVVLAPSLINRRGSWGNFLSIADFSRPKLEEILRLAIAIKEFPEQHSHALQGRILLMMFQKPSFRTRISFESAMIRLGGHTIMVDLAEAPVGPRETPADMARTGSRYVDAILARLFSHDDLLALADHSSVPVINGLTDVEHPCQALGDLLTIQEQFGRLQGVRVTFMGDGRNNVAHSLLDACGKLGIHLTVSCPKAAEFQPAEAVLARARRFALESGAHLRISNDPVHDVDGADVIYTDTWTGYQVPIERRAERESCLAPFRVTSALFNRAHPRAVFMHSLPAWRGKELDADVIDGPRSIVFAQAENRLHTEKAVLLTLIR
jgi:ornithine carbamoyltransferase